MRKSVFKILLAGVAMTFGSMLATNARAAAPVVTFPIVASLDCDGTISGSSDANAPDGNFAMLGAWAGGAAPFKTDVPPTSAKKGGPVATTMGLIIDHSCTLQDANGFIDTVPQSPCAQVLFATGTYTVNSSGLPKAGTVSLTFADEPAFNGALAEPAGADPFDGCSATFDVYPFSSSVKGKRAPNTGSTLGLTSLTGSCKSAGAHITMSCVSRNDH